MVGFCVSARGWGSCDCEWAFSFGGLRGLAGGGWGVGDKWGCLLG